MIDVDAERFEELVADALDALPPELGQLMENVAVFVEDDHPDGLYGLYEGIPLTERGDYGVGWGELPMPDRITVFRVPICQDALDEEDVVEEVLVTIVHEVAHHFGIDDERLTELGWD
ncbi:MAG TPA: metallopeptidase family protein [Acidimicrobiales bacterium]